ncbi:hypothetical protein KFL_005680020 [Klebsormidium nitens]|uniref:Uncharacterized protein n=1 Tax=Klebsormidium nitens TaxID=105231 RepID=A0A1Y1IG57_KLENI|nr:hypothetical protein KFL_005680020 [Klebsormidium nitens]|eukprot:GAQ89835.1 hypothetical protein KFL_005680020 [Klebsormidium nitens]
MLDYESILVAVSITFFILTLVIGRLLGLSELTKKGLPCPLQALAGKALCHIHHKSAELEETRKKEEAARTARGVKLCIGGGEQKCPDKAELPLDSDQSTCDACIKKIRERSLVNKAKRDAATAERNKAKATKGVKECIACHKERPDADFVAERRAKGGGEPVSDRCKACRERAKEDLHESSSDLHESSSGAGVVWSS